MKLPCFVSDSAMVRQNMQETQVRYALRSWKPIMVFNKEVAAMA